MEIKEMIEKIQAIFPLEEWLCINILIALKLIEICPKCQGTGSREHYQSLGDGIASIDTVPCNCYERKGYVAKTKPQIPTGLN